MSSGSTVVAKGYEPYFLEELDPAIPWLAKGTKIAVNAGASDVHGLADAVKELIKKHEVDLKVGVVNGDDVTDVVLDLYKKGEKFLNLPANKSIRSGVMTLSAPSAISVALVLLYALRTAPTLFCAAVSPTPPSQSVLPCGGTAGAVMTSTL